MSKEECTVCKGKDPDCSHEPLSCDSCGWVIKGDEVHAETKEGETICEHCLGADEQREPH